MGVGVEAEAEAEAAAGEHAVGDGGTIAGTVHRTGDAIASPITEIERTFETRGVASGSENGARRSGAASGAEGRHRRVELGLLLAATLGTPEMCR